MAPVPMKDKLLEWGHSCQSCFGSALCASCGSDPVSVAAGSIHLSGAPAGGHLIHFTSVLASGRAEGDVF